jgi:hypothetical protein
MSNARKGAPRTPVLVHLRTTVPTRPLKRFGHSRQRRIFCEVHWSKSGAVDASGQPTATGVALDYSRC